MYAAAVEEEEVRSMLSIYNCALCFPNLLHL